MMNYHLVACKTLKQNMFIFYKLTCTSPSEEATSSRVLFGTNSSTVSLHVEVDGKFPLPFEVEGKFPLPFKVEEKFPLQFEVEGKFPLLVKGKVTPEVDGILRVDALQEAVERPQQEFSLGTTQQQKLSRKKSLTLPKKVCNEGKKIKWDVQQYVQSINQSN